ncbi:UTRA domain-containing protein [Burkholderia cepacia]|uniref:UTRA domain-containing protein n=1 Tax=Burkholderia cepacia TaxID=292 RepID=UPI000757E512|nr:UTRA domain-containing protein [Burkholderia cepacia]KVH35421.1 hypothetical protein WS88_20650 [Burkholderia cepacia]
MNAAGICPVKALRQRRAELASGLDADLLGIRSGDPVLHIERRSFYRGDRYDYLAVMGKA